MTEQWNAQLVSSKGGGGEVLDELVARLGLEGTGFSRLGLRLDDRRVVVELIRTGRSHDLFRRVTGVHLTVKFGGRARSAPLFELEGDEPTILLRRETALDRRDKERGLTVEVQTGYAGFDHAVYVDNDASEADARRVLSTEATRQAVLRLLEHHSSVRISPTGVTVRQDAKQEAFDTDVLLETLEDLLIVARAGGPSAERPRRSGELLLGVAAGFAALMGCYAVLAHQAWPTSLLVAAPGVLAGAAVALFARPTIEDICRGDAGSGKRSSTILLLLSAATAALVFAALAHANGALDSSEGEHWKGEVMLVMSGKRSSTVTVRWDNDGSRELLDADQAVSPGARVNELRHPGALGFTWVERRSFTNHR